MAKPTRGVNRSLTNDLTTMISFQYLLSVNAAPITNATATSITFPLSKNALKSFMTWPNPDPTFWVDPFIFAAAELPNFLDLSVNDLNLLDLDSA